MQRTKLTSRQVMARLGVSYSRICDMNRKGELVPEVDQWGHNLYDAKQVEDLAERRSTSKYVAAARKRLEAAKRAGGD